MKMKKEIREVEFRLRCVSHKVRKKEEHVYVLLDENNDRYNYTEFIDEKGKVCDWTITDECGDSANHMEERIQLFLGTFND